MIDNKICFYFTDEKSIFFEVNDLDLNKIDDKNYWVSKFENDIEKKTRSLNETILNKTDFMFVFTVNSLSNEISFISNMLRDLYTCSEKKLFTIKEEKYSGLEKYDFYKIYLSEEEYRELKGKYIIETFWYNEMISQDKDLRNIASRNKEVNYKLIKHNSLTNEEIETLEMFDFEKQNLSISYLQHHFDRKIELESLKYSLEEYSDKVNDLIDIINSNDIGTKFKYDEFILYKLNGYSPKKELLNDKSSLYLKLKNQGMELYYEPNFGTNDLCFLVFDDAEYETMFSFNTSIGGFCYLIYLLSHNICFYENDILETFEWPQLNLIDKKTYEKVYEHINKSKYFIDNRNGFENIAKLINEQKDLPEDINKIIDENIMDLLS
jgi:hypothetical protein